MIAPPMMAESLLTPSGITLSSLKGNSASEHRKKKRRNKHSQTNIYRQKYKLTKQMSNIQLISSEERPIGTHSSLNYQTNWQSVF